MAPDLAPVRKASRNATTARQHWTAPDLAPVRKASRNATTARQLWMAQGLGPALNIKAEMTSLASIPKRGAIEAAPSRALAAATRTVELGGVVAARAEAEEAATVREIRNGKDILKGFYTLD